MKLTKKKSRFVPLKGPSLLESRPPPLPPYNYSSNDFPPLGLALSSPESSETGESRSNNMAMSMSMMMSGGGINGMSPSPPSSCPSPVVSLTPSPSEAHSMTMTEGRVCGEEVACGSGEPMNKMVPAPSSVKRTIFLPDGNVQSLPGSMLADQYGIAGFIVGKLQGMSGPLPLPDTIAEEVQSEGGVRDYPNSYFVRSSEPSVTGEYPPEPLPCYELSSNLIRGPSNSGFDGEPNMFQSLNTWTVKPQLYNDDLLFYLFYTFTQDLLQISAAQQLYNRGWRFHRDFQVWIKPLDRAIYQSLGDSRETGVYQVFDLDMWKVIERELLLRCDGFEGPPAHMYPNVATLPVGTFLYDH